MKKSHIFLLGITLFILPAETFSMRDFAAYVWQSLTNNSRSTHEDPFEWPADPLTNESVSSLLRQSVCAKRYAEPFLFGASTSEHQCSKQCSPRTCSWERFAQERNLAHPHDPRHAIDLWKNYRSYINYARDVLGLNALRFSIEWALVQPHGPEEFDQEALAHYADMFIYCIEKGITPIVCFHHYTDPCWFIDAGGFEREENTAFFVQFCVATYGAMMDALRTKTRARFHLATIAQPLFATFNSPEGYAFKAYLQLKAPPARKDKKGLSYVVNCLKNMMEAHVDVYYALKDRYAACDGVLKQTVKSPQVGFLKNIIQLDPAKKKAKHRWCSGITRMACAVGNLLQNECIYQFFTSGKFNVYVPTQVKVRHTNLAAIGALDFIGINYYSNRHMHLGSGVQETNESLKTDNSNYRFYPQGLYRAIVEVTEKLAGTLAIPMYVTENGIATRSDAKRSQFYREYLYALGRALEEGYDVRGYLTWTLADNYEWPNLEDDVPRVYGLCRVNPKFPEHLILKEGAKAYVEILKAVS